VKLIEAMKQLKDLGVKAADLQAKVAATCAHLDYETPVYADPKAQVSTWIQAHSDILKEMLRLRTAIQRTNLATNVTIELGGVQVTKCITEWIHRRRDLANTEMQMWAKLGDRGLKEGVINQSTGEPKAIKIVRNFDPKERDVKLDLYRSEPSKIDGSLEVVNAVTELA
jgi:2-succinyl-5-enolpyruvyl-6-hydroxy-3-cyclohexene-1-carboxylate synthase